MGASYLYWLDDQPDAQAFEALPCRAPGAIGLWLGGHSTLGPDERISRALAYRTRNGASLRQCVRPHRNTTSDATRSHEPPLHLHGGSTRVRVQCYLHGAIPAHRVVRNRRAHAGTEHAVHLRRSAHFSRPHRLEERRQVRSYQLERPPGSPKPQAQMGLSRARAEVKHEMEDGRHQNRAVNQNEVNTSVRAPVPTIMTA